MIEDTRGIATLHYYRAIVINQSVSRYFMTPAGVTAIIDTKYYTVIDSTLAASVDAVTAVITTAAPMSGTSL